MRFESSMTEIANARPELTEYHKSFIRGLNTGKAKNICVFKKKIKQGNYWLAYTSFIWP